MKSKLILCLTLVLCGAFVYAAFVFIYEPSPVERLSGAAMQGNLDLLKKLEAKGVSLDAQNIHAHNWTPLMAAIYEQQTNIIQYLLTRNLKLNLQDSAGMTALMWAITTRDTNTARLILEKDADVSDLLNIQQRILPGMTRAQLQKSFRLAEGFATAKNGIFVCNRCPQIRIVVDFTLSEPKHELWDLRSTDVISKISKPSIQWDADLDNLDP